MKNPTRLETKTKPLYAAPIPIEDLTDNQLKAELNIYAAKTNIIPRKAI